MNGIGWITVAEAARLCGTDELRITLWMNGNHIAYARFDGILMIDGASLAALFSRNRVAGHDIRQRQADGTGQTTGNAVQQHGGQRREGVAQMEAGPRAKDVRDAEELIRDKAQRGHDADDADFLHGEFRFGQRCDQQCQGCYDEQQQPHRCGRHSFVHLY